MIFENTIIDLFKHIIRMDSFIELPSEGYSMFPFIRRGDICRFVPCDANKLEEGDVVLFHYENGQLVAHRFSHSTYIKNVRHFYFKGDTNLGFDRPVTEYQLIGKLKRIKRLNKEINAWNFVYKSWGKLILKAPAISIILKKYLEFIQAVSRLQSKVSS